MRRDVRKEITNDESKQLLLKGLCELRDICVKYDLAYYLMFGTLIGAVRHKGFIPWDDDIDIVMPRADYERLISLASEIESEDWHIVSYKNQPGYCFAWAKFCNKKTEVVPSRFNTGYVYGCSIDVFPIDEFTAESESDALKIVEKFNSRYHELEREYRYTGVYATGFANGIKRFIKKVHFIYACRRKGSWKARLNACEREIQSFSGADNEYVTYMFTTNKPFVFKQSDFKSSEPQMMPFEGEMFAVPAEYDHILSTIYGDYMKMPPEDKQVATHTAKILKKDLQSSTEQNSKQGAEDRHQLQYRVIEKPDWITYDMIAEILHDAHRSNVEKGMHFVASYQDGEETERRLGDGGKFFVALTDDNTIVGVGAVSLHESCTGWYGKKQPYGEIKMVGVPEKYKGLGISSALYKKMEEFGFSVNELMVMNTARDNNIVLDSNARHGWTYVDYKSWSRTDYYSPVMAKWKNGCPYSKAFCRLMFNYRRLYTILVRRKNGQQRLIFGLLKNEKKGKIN